MSYGLPLTQAITSLRSILSRGWGIDEADVYLGMVGMLTWTILFMAIAIVTLKAKRR